MKSKGVILRHVLLWILYIGFEVGYLHVSVKTLASLTHFVIYYLLNIGLFYLNALVTLNYAFFRTNRPYLVYIFLLIPEIAIYLGIKVVLDALLSSPQLTILQVINLGKLYFLANFWRGVNFIGLSIAYFSTLYMIRFKDRNHIIETERLKAIAGQLELENKYVSMENAYLQNQISPHLLFNTLNFIYNAVEEYSEKAGKGVMYLSGLMRYSLISTNNQNKVRLSDEIVQIESLVALSRLRFGDDLYLTFKKNGEINNQEIIPLLLVTLVENMLKHGDLWEPTHPALISLNVTKQTLVFMTENKMRPAASHLNTGIGLINLEKRLQNFYLERYSLQIDSDADYFNVKLRIDL
jgi:two-component system LytT family sensor kinase